MTTSPRTLEIKMGLPFIFFFKALLVSFSGPDSTLPYLFLYVLLSLDFSWTLGSSSASILMMIGSDFWLKSETYVV